MKSFFRLLLGLVHDARIKRRGGEIVRGCDGVDITGEMQVESSIGDYANSRRLPRRPDARWDPCEGCANGSDHFLARCAPSACESPTVVVVLPHRRGCERDGWGLDIFAVRFVLSSSRISSFTFAL